VTSYDRFAPYYDAFYEHIVDYEGDVEYLEAVFAAHSRVPVRRVLDLGAGTGAHAARLAARGYHVHGVELSAPQVEIARAKVPGARFDVGDFTRAQPDGPFDAAICMFGAWCYATTDETAGRALDLARERLPGGGVLVFESWSPYGFEPPQNWGEAELEDGRRLVRLTRPLLPVRDDVYRFAMEILVLRGDELTDHFVEEHALRLRTPYQTQKLVEAHGFEVAAFTNGERDGKSLDAPRPDALRVMCIARVAR
jgi:dTDP-3-amino-3,6-dideoxy-alpha-D-glucopyranose N,N-dimethyltransferase/dTDP-3-amino-3,4,6-trideoxy-alpha-D-glucopyranose N,N-dimethyltransferase